MDDTTLSAANSLPMLLSVEGFLLAVVTFTVTLDNPDRPNPFKGPISAQNLCEGAAWLTALTSLGAGASWIELFMQGSHLMAWPQVVVGIVLVIVIVVQPAIAILLARGNRRG